MNDTEATTPAAEIERLKAQLSALSRLGEHMRLAAQAYWEGSGQDDGFVESMCAWDQALEQMEETAQAHDQEVALRTLALLRPVLEVVQEPEDQSWSMSLPVMPGHVGGGTSLGEAAHAAADAAEAWLEAALDRSGPEEDKR
jgi:predicted RNase H-like HicB family nuclease